MSRLQKKYEFTTKGVFTLGCFIGVLIFLLLYGVQVLDVTNDSYLTNGYIEKDIVQHYAGWMLYRDSPWQFPLGAGQNIAYPHGSAVSYTDSIPLVAIFFKIFRDILPETFQYFGWYVLVSFGLQGGAAALIISRITKKIELIALSSVLLVCTPVLIERAFRHTALSSQFFVLFALYYYLKNRNQSGWKSVLPFFVINALAIGIHPYFLPFTYGIMFAFCAEKALKQKDYIKQGCYIAASCALTLLVGYVIGAFYLAGFDALPYGYFGMNLNALYNPASMGMGTWSSILQAQGYPLGQIEGFNYLGFGVILFIPVALLCSIVHHKTRLFHVIWQCLKSHVGYVIALVLLLIFAVGPDIYWNDQLLFSIPYPDILLNRVFGIFRASGRFGNLLVYSIVLTVLYCVIKYCKRAVACVLLVVLVAVQIFDISPALVSKYNYFHGIDENLQEQVAKEYLSSSFWQDTVEQYDELYLIDTTFNAGYLDVVLIYAKAHKIVNANFEARVDGLQNSVVFTAVRSSIKDGTLGDNQIFVTCNPDEFYEAFLAGYVHIYKVDTQYVFLSQPLSQEQIDGYVAEGSFEVVTDSSEYFTHI